MKKNRLVGNGLAVALIGASLLVGPASAGPEDPVPPSAAKPAAAPVPKSMTLQGRVTDSRSQALRGVRVRVFEGGVLQASAVSGDDGAYSVPLPDPAHDATQVVWWIPVGDALVPEAALLRESSAAQSLGLWSPCLARITASRDDTARYEAVLHDVVLYDEAEKAGRLAEADCLKAGSFRGGEKADPGSKRP